MAVQAVNKWLIGTISATLLASATVWEGTEYYAYKDIVGVPTVCQGYTGKGIIFGRKYSAEECNTFLRTDLIEHSTGVLNCVTKALTIEQFNAFTLMAFNVGVKGFCGSRAVKLFNEGKTKEACWAMSNGPDGKPVWSYGDGKFIQGLYNRRVYERSMCLGVPYVKP